nr:sorting and assembly machinery component 50 homolog B-like [Tanacetum cinerariifolium]
MGKKDDPINEIEENEEEEEEEDDDDFDDEEEEEEESEKPKLDKAKMEKVFHRISTERVPLRVHDVIIKGNTKTKDSLIESLIETLKTATSVQELLQAATVANARLQKLDIFDSVNITLDSGPADLPGTTNVVVEVVEIKNPLTGDIGIFTKPEILLLLLLLHRNHHHLLLLLLRFLRFH